MTMSAFSLWRHMERSHGIVLPYIRGVDVREGGPETYKVSLLQILKSVECPVEGFRSRANTPVILRENLMYRRWKLKVTIMQEGPEPLPRCDQCKMQMPAASILKHM